MSQERRSGSRDAGGFKAQLAALTKQKLSAVQLEDYDEAKRLKLEIDTLVAATNAARSNVRKADSSTNNRKAKRSRKK